MHSEASTWMGTDELRQVIDYAKFAPVHEHLASRFSNNPFSCVIDAVGVQEVYTHCAAYLAPGKSFVTVGVMLKSLSYTSFLSAISSIVQNTFWPRMLWGTPRTWTMVSMMEPDRRALERLRDLIGEGKLRPVVDSCWAMEDALKVGLKEIRRRLSRLC